MNTPDLLKNLTLDYWYKVFIVLGSVLFIVSLIFDVKVLTNQQAVLLSAGLFLLGMGEWKNHKPQFGFLPPNAHNGGHTFQLEYNRWKPNLIGIIFDIAGLVLIYTFINSLMGYPLYQPLMKIIPTITPTP